MQEPLNQGVQSWSPEVTAAAIAAIASIAASLLSLLSALSARRNEVRAVELAAKFAREQELAGAARVKLEERTKRTLQSLEAHISLLQRVRDILGTLLSAPQGAMTRSEAKTKLQSAVEALMSAYEEAAAALDDDLLDILHQAKGEASAALTQLSAARPGQQEIADGERHTFTTLRDTLLDRQHVLRDARSRLLVSQLT